MESKFANTIKNGGTVKNVEWEIIYGVNSRPTKIKVKAKLNGIINEYEHFN